MKQKYEVQGEREFTGRDEKQNKPELSNVRVSKAMKRAGFK